MGKGSACHGGRRGWPVAAGLLALLLPLIPLFSPERYAFEDWISQVWQVGYSGEYFRRHHELPSAIATTSAVGILYPAFYSPILYSLLALFASWFRADHVMQGAILVTSSAQFASVYFCARRSGSGRAAAIALAALAHWSIYTWTNVYNRNALSEFFGTSLLTVAFALFYVAAGEEDRRRRRALGSLALAAATLMAGSHAITFLFGSVALLWLIAPYAWRRGGAGRLLDWLVPAALGLCLLLPWMSLVLQFHDRLRIVEVSLGLRHLPGIDRLGVRLLPWPYDGRVAASGPQLVDTPYLDAQLNLALLVFLLLAVLPRVPFRALAGRSREAAGPATVCAAALVGFALTFGWSVSEGAALFGTPSVLERMQYAYRLVAYQNLFLLAAVLSGLHAAGCAISRGQGAVLVLCLLAAAGGVIVKQGRVVAGGHASLIPPEKYSWEDRSRYTQVPLSLLGVLDYTVPGRLPVVKEKAELSPGDLLAPFPIGRHDDFGRAGAIDVDLKSAGRVITSALSFPWLHLELDRQPVPEARKFLYYGLVGVRDVPPGRHRLSVRYEPPRIWTLAFQCVPILMLAWLAAAGLRWWGWR